MRLLLFTQQPVCGEEKWEHERGHRDQLEEAAPVILRISQSVRALNQRCAAEEVAKLQENETEEEQVEQAQRDADFNDAEREHLRLSRLSRIAHTAILHHAAFR